MTQKSSLRNVGGRSSRHGRVRSLLRCCLPAACGHAAARLADRQHDAAAGGRAWARARVQAAACLRLVLLLLLRLCLSRPVFLPAKLHQRPGQQSRPRGLPDCSQAAETAGRRQGAGSLHCLLRPARLGLGSALPLLSRSPRCSTSCTASLRASTSACRRSAATASCWLTALCAQGDRMPWPTTPGTS